jgi:hypothetical protein
MQNVEISNLKFVFHQQRTHHFDEFGVVCNFDVAVHVSCAPTGLGPCQLVHTVRIGVEAEQVDLVVSNARVEDVLDFLCIITGLGPARAPHNLSGLFIFTVIVGVKRVRSRALAESNRPNRLTCGGLAKVVVVNVIPIGFIIITGFVVVIGWLVVTIIWRRAFRKFKTVQRVLVLLHGLIIITVFLWIEDGLDT